MLSSTSAARLSSGIVRPVESAVKPSRRITKARRHGFCNLRALALLLRGGNRPNSSIWREQDASIIAPGREGSQSGRLPGYGRKGKPLPGLPRPGGGQGRLGVSLPPVVPL